MELPPNKVRSLYDGRYECDVLKGNRKYVDVF